MTIECTEYKPINKGSLLGYANIWVPKMGLEIYGCSLHMKEGRRWVNLPSREYTDRETGEKKYISVIRFRDKEYANLFGEIAKKAIEKWCAENNQQPMQDQQSNEEIPF